jgi:hypothetical protein
MTKKLKVNVTCPECGKAALFTGTDEGLRKQWACPECGRMVRYEISPKVGKQRQTGEEKRQQSGGKKRAAAWSFPGLAEVQQKLREAPPLPVTGERSGTPAGSPALGGQTPNAQPAGRSQTQTVDVGEFPWEDALGTLAAVNIVLAVFGAIWLAAVADWEPWGIGVAFGLFWSELLLSALLLTIARAARLLSRATLATGTR